MSTTETEAPTRLPLGRIVVGAHNPRGEIDTDSEAFTELCTSIQTEGILQPVLVGSRDLEGNYPLIAGHRRYAAASKLDLAEMPVLQAEINPADPRAKQAAMAENLHRQNLSKLQEARALEDLREGLGLTQIEAAEMLGKSERWARDRQKLLDLPTPVAMAFDKGALADQAVGHLVEVGRLAPKVATTLAEMAEEVAPEGGPQLGTKGTVPAAIERLVAETKAGKDGRSPLGCIVSATDYVQYPALVAAGVPQELLRGLKKRMAAVEKVEMGPSFFYHGTYVEFEEADVDAARAYGCLLELDGVNRWNEPRTLRWITDVKFLADRLPDMVDRAEERYKTELAAKKSSAGKSAARAKAPPKSPAEKEAAKAAAEAAARYKTNAESANLELGQLIARAFEAPKVTLEEAKAIAQLLLANEGPAMGGSYAYVDRGLQGHDDKHDCATFDPAFTAAKKIDEALEKAKSPEQVWGLLLRLMVGATFADPIVERLRSHRRTWNMPREEGLRERIHMIAHKRKVLPSTIDKRLRREAKEKRDAEKRAGYQSMGRILELLASSKNQLRINELASKSSGKSKSKLFQSGYLNPPSVGRILAALHRKQFVTLDERKGHEKESTAGITPKGRKELERLKELERKAQLEEGAS